jgi:broad specificity phosphatase PhoE
VRLLLVRHCTSEANGHRLAGRLPGVRLTEEGREQARSLASHLEPLRPVAIYSSPIDRARATAAPIAERLGTETVIEQGLTEIEFGSWSGATFAELESDPTWRQFNADPAGDVIPGGEAFTAVADRASHAIALIVSRHSSGCVVAVSHGDVIRLVVARMLGMPLNLFRRLTVEPGATCELILTTPGAGMLRLDAFNHARCHHRLSATR